MTAFLLADEPADETDPPVLTFSRIDNGRFYQHPDGEDGVIDASIAKARYWLDGQKWGAMFRPGRHSPETILRPIATELGVTIEYFHFAGEVTDLQVAARRAGWVKKEWITPVEEPGWSMIRPGQRETPADDKS